MPQGSCCEPMLFQVFTNNVGNNIVSSLLFVDYLKIFRVIKNNDDLLVLHCNLNSLMEWSDRNGLNLNTSKYSVITFSKSENPSQYTYDINENALMWSLEIKDLVVILDRQLKFTQQDYWTSI